MLTGQSLQPHHRALADQVLADDPVVESFQDVKTTVLGPQTFRFKAEVDFDGRMVARRYLESLSESERQEFQRALGDEAGRQAALEDFGEHLVTALAMEIDRIEEKMRDKLQARLADPALYQDPALSQSVAADDRATTARLEELYERWEDLGARIEELEAAIAKGEAILSDPTLYTADPQRFANISQGIENARAEKDAAEERWLELAEQSGA